MTTSAVSGANSMGDGMVKIEVINMSSPTNRTGTSVMKVPFSSLSRTMQFIHRAGGKITNVTKLASSEQLTSTPSPSTPPDTSPPVAAAPAPSADPVVEPQLVRSAPKAAQSNNNNKNSKRGGKKR